MKLMGQMGMLLYVPGVCYEFVAAKGGDSHRRGDNVWVRVKN
jgi:hypothetical protein